MLNCGIRMQIFAGAASKKSNFAGASVGAIVLATAAHASDIGGQSLLAHGPWNWTGFYVGGNVGAAWARSSIVNDPTSAFPWLNGSTSNDRTGVIGGLQGGYNWQWAGLVLGIEGDLSFASVDRSVAAANVAGPGFEDSFRSRLDWLATIRGRLGWAVDRALIYGTGGVAFAGLKDELVSPPPTLGGFTASTDSSVTGWAAGGGLEYAFTGHWTAKAEYLHVDFGNRTATVGSPTPGYAFKFKDSLDIARVGINYKF